MKLENILNLQELVLNHIKKFFKEHKEALNYKIKVYILNKNKLYSVKNIKFIVEVSPETLNKAANDDNFDQLKEELIGHMLKEIKKAA